MFFFLFSHIVFETCDVFNSTDQMIARALTRRRGIGLMPDGVDGSREPLAMCKVK